MMVDIVSFLFELIEKMVLASVPAVGFAMVFRVPVRALKYCALLGAMGYGARSILLSGGMNIEWATFIASALIGIVGIHWSRRLLAHPKVFTVAAIIPMFPGINAYLAMLAVVKISQTGYSAELFEMLVSNFFRASFIVGAISIGLSVPGLWLYRKRPRV